MERDPTPSEKRDGDEAIAAAHMLDRNVAPRSASTLSQNGAPSPANSNGAALYSVLYPTIPRHETRPPYPAPAHTVYPKDGFRNPHLGDMQMQPFFEPFSKGSLYRPAILPLDIDERLDKSSIWIQVNSAGAPTYYVPPTCSGCASPAVAQHCDRAWPYCSRCRNKQIECVRGPSWSAMRPRSHRRNLKAELKQEEAKLRQGSVENGDATSEHVKSVTPTPRDTELAETSPKPLDDSAVQVIDVHDSTRYSAAQKGKGKATNGTTEKVVAPQAGEDVEMVDESESENEYTGRYGIASHDIADGGRGKRVKKKRRLSASDEIDPNLLRADFTVKKSRPSSSQMDRPYSLPFPARVIAKRTAAQIREDDEYQARVLINDGKPRLIKHPPLSAVTRRGLFATAEYMSRPVKTVGASVEIGPGGLARGVLLEGVAPGEVNWWPLKQKTGTIMVHIGKARDRWIRDGPPVPPPEIDPPASDLDTLPRATTPPFNLTKSIMTVDKNARSTARIHPSRKDAGFDGPHSQDHAPAEEPAIAALHMAQRAGTPVALVVSKDYSMVPFKVNKPLEVLGWFWVLDAWVEDADSISTEKEPNRVRWKFRFEWCETAQGRPWWVEADVHEVPTPDLPKEIEVDVHEEAWQFKGPDERTSRTVRSVYSPRGGFVSRMDQSSVDYGRRCMACQLVSRTVYSNARMCLNERCHKFFVEPLNLETGVRYSAREGTPFIQTLVPRISPTALGLQLKPDKIKGPTSEMTGALAGRDYWRGWVCSVCSSAQERRHWSGWKCEDCSYRCEHNPKRRIYTADFLRSPSRLVHSGPRDDAGFPEWPFPVTRTHRAQLQDNLIWFRHKLDPGISGGSEVLHIVHWDQTRRTNSDIALNRLQSFHIREEMPFLRQHSLAPEGTKAVDRTLSPFYTAYHGPIIARRIPDLPVDLTLSKVRFSSMDPLLILLEDVNRQRWPGHPEFNSVLYVACPPNLAASAYPKIELPHGSYLAIKFLGSDGSVRIRKGSQNPHSKTGKLTVNHAETIYCQAGPDGLEVQPILDGFGFFCISLHDGRQGVSEAHNESLGSAVKKNEAKSKAQSAQAKPVIISLADWYIGYEALAKVSEPAAVEVDTKPDINPEITDGKDGDDRPRFDPNLKYGYIGPDDEVEPTYIDPPQVPNPKRHSITEPAEIVAPPLKSNTAAKRGRKSGVPAELDGGSETMSTSGKPPPKKRGRKSAVETESVGVSENSSEVGIGTESVGGFSFVTGARGKRKSKGKAA